ncbi:MAG: tRNA preQ1(34) S-adenosylmethionine ribosyltransferase-isomerase QueA [Pseudomonadota bacterium]
MRVDAFDFDLPDDRIALRPAKPRDAARLLVVRPGGRAFEDRIVRELPDVLRAGDLLVVNDTRVLNAQLKAVRPARAEGSGGDVAIDVTLIKRRSDDAWDAFVRPLKRLKAADTLGFGGFSAVVEAIDRAVVRLRFDRAGADLDRAVDAAGAPPLPPYIARRRAPDEADTEDYQTAFAERDGSVAAPTAGLHFTPDLLDRLAASGVRRTSVTLHVGAGTFLPVSAEDTDNHVMHAEYGEVSEEAAEEIARTRDAGGRVVAVGTTSLRILESACDLGGVVHPFAGETDIFITPGAPVRSIDLLMTNFHLPRSTLFMLVSALAGTERMKAAYAHAIKAGYRFFSYGDASLIPNESARIAAEATS